MKIEVYQFMWLILAGSFLGYLLEMVWYRKLRGKWISRKGVIYGTYSPIYGAALAGCWLLFGRIKRKGLLMVFLTGSCVGSMFEYFCGFLQEKIFGTKSWDYSKKPFQIKGRICLEFAVYWGIAAVAACYAVLPMLFQIFAILHETKLLPVITVLFLMFSADCLISFLACFRQRIRRNRWYANNALEHFLDVHYSDERLDSIFTEIRILDSCIG